MACSSKPETSAAGTAPVSEPRSLPQAKGGTFNYIDVINGVSDLTHGTVTLPRRPELFIAGWAVDATTKLPAAKVYIDLDGQIYPAKYGGARADVANNFKEPAFTNSGFTATIPTPADNAEHRLTLYIVGSESSQYYVGASVVFVIK